MKTCQCVIFLMLLSLQVSAQTIFKQQINLEAQQKITKQLSINADSCAAPFDLYGQFSPLGNDQYMLYLTWDMEPPDDGWISWDDGENFSGVGTCPDCWIWAAAKWDSGFLLEYDGYKITKIKAFLYDNKYVDLTFLLWNNEIIGSPIYSYLYDTVIGGEWIEHSIDSLIIINGELEYWVGYKVWLSEPANFPLGTDIGPAIPGYGDKISADDGNTWDNLSDFGLDYNWNIQFYVKDSAGNEKQVGHKSVNNSLFLAGFNVYESINGSDFEFMKFFPYTPETNYLGFQLDANPYERCYQLTAVWANPVDTCESLPARAKNNPDEDYVCFWLVNQHQHESYFKDKLKLTCQPNPFSSVTTIEYQLDNQSEVNLLIYNCRGEVVYKVSEYQQAGSQQLQWDAKGLSAGLYFIRLENGGKRTMGKMIKFKN